ncbi:NUDIX domain-containing protein [Microvirga aerophila]|uniref:GDP-mannose pyrophosphatase n=1 Tax=Microvirga aerophila TaxID=670291 RepID=A0A512BSJ9_9HYPH|nr:NUDIX hydrolase [Microvirga aerophila]GEO14968.1 ADP-ribose pyrophosphatase [Microvirga aerophila]
MPDQINPWETLSSQRFYESRYVDVDQDEVRHRSGRIHPYTALRFRFYVIAVLPIFADGSTRLIGQYRYLARDYTWELPRGSGSKSVDPLETAQRELKEETGATAGQWLELFRLMVSPGVTDERAPCFVAWDLSQGAADPDSQEDLTIRRLPFRDAVAAALDGTISDAASVATLLAVHTRAAQGNLPADLMRRLR